MNVNQVFYSDARIVYVAGDVHGDFDFAESTISCFLGQRRDGDLLIFLGDYTDYGTQHIDVVKYLSKMASKHNDIILLMGNHEHYTPNYSPIFATNATFDYLIYEAKRRYGGWMRFVEDHYRSFLEQLHIAAIVNNALFVHGGISKKITCREALEKEIYKEDLLWSDPKRDLSASNEDWFNPRGGGVLWDRSVTARVPQSLGVQWIIRGHERSKAVGRGEFPIISHDGRIVTVHGNHEYEEQWLLKLDTIEGRFAKLDFDADYYVNLDEPLRYRLSSDSYETILP